jgi:hypothetical protein
MKRKLFLGLIVLGLILAAGGIYTLFSKPDPLKITELGLANLTKSDSFSYSITQKQTVQGQERLLTRISGYKNGENIHLQGQIAGSEVEMIITRDTLYNKDPFSKEWVKFNDISVAQRVFLVELDPLATLQLKELGEVVLKGQETVDGKKCWVCTLKPSIQNQLLESFWTNFEYTLYIPKTSKTVSKAEVTAKNKETQEPMTIVLEFKDIGKKISIEPPASYK